jgi:HK97 family phage major capsid protein
MKLPVQFRKIESGEIDREKRTVSLSFSSQNPVKRAFGREYLSHAPSAIDTRRLSIGAVPLLLNHDWSKPVGRITDFQVRDGKSYATALISRSALGEEILNDIQDGIRNNVSVGFIPRAMKKLKRSEVTDLLGDLLDDDDNPLDEDDDDDDEEDDDDIDTFSIEKWEPIEVSLVSVPADPSVGIGRNDDELFEVRMLDVEAEPEVVISKESPKTMSENAADTTKETPKVEVLNEDFTKTRELESVRMREIQKIGHEFGFNKEAYEFVRDGKTVADFNALVLRSIKPRPSVSLAEPNLGYNKKDTETYSIVRAINKQIKAVKGEGVMDGIEGEVSRGLAQMHGADPMGFYVPDFALTAGRRDMVVGTPSLGGLTVQTTVDTDLIPILRNKMVCLQAGARLMTGLVGNLSIPRQNAAATVSWNTEIAALTESDQGFDSILLSPNRVGGWTNYSKKLLAQSSLDIEGIVRDDLISIVAIAQDAAALNGTGTNQPTGIFNTTANTGLPYNYSMTAPAITFGSGYPSWSQVVQFAGNLELGNQVLDTSAAYITTPAVKSAWKTLSKSDPRQTSSFFPSFIWEAGDEVNGYKAFATNQVANNKVVFGKWNELILSQWAGLDVVVDIFSLAPNAEVRVIVNLFCDVKFRYASAFCCSTNSGVSN